MNEWMNELREKKCLLKGEKKTKLSEMALEMPHFDRKFICFYAQCIMGFAPLLDSDSELLLLSCHPHSGFSFGMKSQGEESAKEKLWKFYFYFNSFI